MEPDVTASLLPEVEDLISSLVTCRLGDIIEGDDFEEFVTFLNDDALSVGKFVIALPLTEGGMAWFLYEITANGDGLEITMGGDEQIYLPADPTYDEKPRELDGLPVWDLKTS